MFRIPARAALPLWMALLPLLLAWPLARLPARFVKRGAARREPRAAPHRGPRA
jgi:hypothetical protein